MTKCSHISQGRAVHSQVWVELQLIQSANTSQLQGAQVNIAQLRLTFGEVGNWIIFRGMSSKWVRLKFLVFLKKILFCTNGERLPNCAPTLTVAAFSLYSLVLRWKEIYLSPGYSKPSTNERIHREIYFVCMLSTHTSDLKWINVKSGKRNHTRQAVINAMSNF